MQQGLRVEALNFAGAAQILPVWEKAEVFAKAHNLEYGVIATLETVTTDLAKAAAIEVQFGARAEAMEGAGVAQAALRHTVPMLELRAISNMVGDRKNWQIQKALGALGTALQKVVEFLQ